MHLWFFLGHRSLDRGVERINKRLSNWFSGQISFVAWQFFFTKSGFLVIRRMEPQTPFENYRHSGVWLGTSLQRPLPSRTFPKPKRSPPFWGKRKYPSPGFGCIRHLLLHAYKVRGIRIRWKGRTRTISFSRIDLESCKPRQQTHCKRIPRDFLGMLVRVIS